MPEGPEVRRAADALHEALAGQPVVAFSARTKAAKAWLEVHPDAFPGRTVARVWSHGKILVGETEPDAAGVAAFFSSHFMMWGRWHIVDPADEIAVTRDRRERARIETPERVAVLFSAPVFEVGLGDPYAGVAHLPTLGPDVLPRAGDYDAAGVRERLLAAPERTVGAALLDQTVVAGIGNYLRAEILWQCRIDPWRAVGDLTEGDWACLDHEIPRVCALAYHDAGRTVSEAEQAQMHEPGMTYNAPQPWSTRHAVFRRTNLPCLRCGAPVRQKRQTTREDVTGENGGDKERIIYFCAVCQNTTVDLPPARPRAFVPADAPDRATDTDALDDDA
ncbi:MAG TPA: DNA-formamidopyrimidine glycosylase family protein [Rubricoccaceae bacterium]|jgi:formamidopyrimidine-DNA glycosylase